VFFIMAAAAERWTQGIIVMIAGFQTTDVETCSAG
jgi:hypothetical protein